MRKRHIIDSPSNSNFAPKRLATTMTTPNAMEMLSTSIKQMQTASATLLKLCEAEGASEHVTTAFSGLSAVIQGVQTLLEVAKRQQPTDGARELERERSIVVYGIQESKAAKPTDRAKEDSEEILQVLDGLGVQVLPQTVYRLGKTIQNPAPNGVLRPRPLKVVLPATHFQRIVLAQWKRCKMELREDPKWRHLNMRMSLPPEVLAEQWKQRQARRESTTNGPFPTTQSLIPK